jgi:hypothetical protein
MLSCMQAFHYHATDLDDSIDLLLTGKKSNPLTAIISGILR